MKKTNKVKKEISIDFVHSEMKRYEIKIKNEEFNLEDRKTYIKYLSISLKYYRKKMLENPFDPEVMRYFGVKIKKEK